jgi:hypothetical protein
LFGLQVQKGRAKRAEAVLLVQVASITNPVLLAEYEENFLGSFTTDGLGVWLPSGTHDQIFVFCLTIEVFL